MKAKAILISAGILGAAGVGLGAFGAHGLEDLLIEKGRTDTFDTAVVYHLFHTALLVGLGTLVLLKPAIRQFRIAAICSLVGILIFSGSLYILSITNITVLGAITPVGGLFFITAWVFLMIGAIKINT